MMFWGLIKLVSFWALGFDLEVRASLHSNRGKGLSPSARSSPLTGEEEISAELPEN